MDRRQSKKRFASTSRSSSPHTKQRRRVESSSSALSLLNSSRSSDELDSGLETFISDCGASSDETFDLSSELSPGLKFSLRTDEKLLVDSPIIKHMEKMSVISRTSKSPKKVTFALSPTTSNVLQVSKKGKKSSENYVIGQSIIKVDAQDGKHCDYKSDMRNTEFRIRRCFIVEHYEAPLDQSGEDKENWPGYQRSSLIFEQHPEIEEDMRSILLEWMMEVSKAYCLRRRTYHMALDYVDRFLTLTENLPKGFLQLVGVASLSLAAKIEEIFPPELKEMAYVTEDAHSKQEIKSMEKIIFAVLGTAFMPVTPSDCVGYFLQKAGVTGYTFSESTEPTENSNIYRENELPSVLYARICRLIDLALLDAQSLEFSYRQIAATAIYFVDKNLHSSKGLSDRSEFDISHHQNCIDWMKRFADAERKMPKITDSSPCTDTRHHHHRIIWPHMQLYNFTLKYDFMPIIEAKRAAATKLQQSEENGDRMMEDMVNRILEDDQLFYDGSVSPPPHNLLTGSTSQSTMFLTPPDSRRQSGASCDSRQTSFHGSG